MAQRTTSSTRTYMKPPKELKDPKTPRRQLSNFRLPLRASWLIIGLLTLFSFFMIFEYHQATHKIESTSSNSTKQVVLVLDKVGKHIILPKGETPTVATVVHAEKLRRQTFFSQARDGDKVIVFTKSKKAYLYRPNTDQLVNVSAVTASPNGPSNVSSP